ncbi:hypothetical protein GCM10022254_67980 [Actinomadura meridiana]|uniref:Uncharacterized protein n=1 Tax=Actinomadura meridiana TaxID=559626 RepID=A0ABP8CMK7_9ACTN
MAEAAPAAPAVPAALAAPTGPVRFAAGEVADRLARLDESLGGLERTPGAIAESALSAVTLLAEVYGEALARVMDRVAGDRRLTETLLDDELVGHLLVLHGVHPEPVERRIAQAIGPGAELDGIEGDTVRVRLASGGCGCGAGKAKEAVREAVLAVAPDATRVEFVEPPPPPAFVPVEALIRRDGAR